MKYASAVVIACFLLSLSVSTTAQIKGGQFLVNGEGSFFNNHSTDERTGNERTIDGITIPSYSYDFKQYVHNLTLTPRVHYFLNENWSLGVAFTFRQLISRRYVSSFDLTSPSDFIAFNVSTNNKNATYLFAPVLEIARHWNLNKKFAITLTGKMLWQWNRLNTLTTSPLGFSEVEGLENWTVSNNGLTFSPDDIFEEKSTSKEQFWNLGVTPQLRYAITPRFGLTATLGGIELSQKYKDDTPGFVRSNPSWSVQINPDSWTFGLYTVLGKGREVE